VTVGPTGIHPTLTEHWRTAADAGAPLAPALVAVLQALAEAGARLGREIARAPLASGLGEAGGVNTYGDRVRRLDVRANDLLLAALQATGVVSVVASEELAAPVAWPDAAPAGSLAVCLDPLDGSLNTDVAGALGTIFGIRAADPTGGADPAEALLAAGTRQVAAGYLVYGPATVFVYARRAGGVHAFLQDPVDGEFRLTGAGLRMPVSGRTYAVNDANWPRWGPAPRALVERFRAATTGQGRYVLRYSGALAVDFHRTLLEGGLYLYPEDSERPEGRIRLLYEAAPLALVAEAAGGRASTGRGRILEVATTDYHQRTPLYIGSAEEVGWAEGCHGAASR
jgi:fructose-1,6-bisphosphatase I